MDKGIVTCNVSVFVSDTQPGDECFITKGYNHWATQATTVLVIRDAIFHTDRRVPIAIVRCHTLDGSQNNVPLLGILSCREFSQFNSRFRKQNKAQNIAKNVPVVSDGE